MLVGFDGFRHDYVDRGLTPNFERMARAGARADALLPVFPTLTFPNFYTIATGMYAGRHGIVSNHFWDAAWDATYRLGDRVAVEDGRWYGGEPIWVTAEKQGMVAAAMFFVGSEAPVAGVRPTYWHRFDDTVDNHTRIANVLEWLSLPPDSRPHIITCYFEILDDVGHRSGPDSPAMGRAIAAADTLLGELLDGIAALPHGDRVHIVVVTDHGMAASDRGVIYLDDHADLDSIRVTMSGPLASLYFEQAAHRDSVFRRLSRVPNLRVALREQAPADWHVADNPRFGDVIVVAEEGWLIARRGRAGAFSRGQHGYVPSPAMRGVFVAVGPRIRAGVRIAPFESIHIYPLLAELLELKPNRDIDGSLSVLSGILLEPAAVSR